MSNVSSEFAHTIKILTSAYYMYIKLIHESSIYSPSRIKSHNPKDHIRFTEDWHIGSILLGLPPEFAVVVGYWSIMICLP